MNELKGKSYLIFDIETYAPSGKPNPKVDEFRILGAYSYKLGRYYFLTNLSQIQKLIDMHNILIGFNSSRKNTAYDKPILERHGIKFNYKIMIDLLEGLKDKYLYKFMGVNLTEFNLRNIAKVFELETQKGDLDYSILKKKPNEWSEIEKQQILKYLKGDIDVTKQLFEKMYNHFKVFSQFVSERDKNRLIWMNTTLSNLTYLSMCYKLGLEPIYSEAPKRKEKIGGLVRNPAGEEFHNLWYLDVTSLYPSIIIMFNMFSNPTITPEETKWFKGNDVFEIKGKYGLSKFNVMSEEFKTMFLQRRPLKKTNPILAYAYKILMNSGYGVLRSPTFASTYYEHTGADICRIGQKINMIMGYYFEKKDFLVVYGDTDSIFVYDKLNRSKDEQKQIVERTLKEIVEFIKSNVPFKFDGFNIDIETGDMIDGIWFFKDKLTNKFKKKNYVMLYQQNKIKIMGLPIIKNNATGLSQHILDNYIKPYIIKNKKIKLPKSYFENLIKQLLHNDISLASVEFKCYNSNSYTGYNQLQAQISRAYFSGKGGKIRLIKNKRIGKVGQSYKYCTIEEAKKAGLKYEDLDLTKVWNELEPFILKEQRCLL